MKGNKLYIILVQDKFDNDLMIGYLPFKQIPKESILQKALFNGELYEAEEKGGFKGIYTLRKYAEEHLKIEKAWRDQDILWIVKLEGKKIKPKKGKKKVKVHGRNNND